LLDRKGLNVPRFMREAALKADAADAKAKAEAAAKEDSAEKKVGDQKQEGATKKEGTQKKRGAETTEGVENTAVAGDAKIGIGAGPSKKQRPAISNQPDKPNKAQAVQNPKPRVTQPLAPPKSIAGQAGNLTEAPIEATLAPAELDDELEKVHELGDTTAFPVPGNESVTLEEKKHDSKTVSPTVPTFGQDAKRQQDKDEDSGEEGDRQTVAGAGEPEPEEENSEHAAQEQENDEEQKKKKREKAGEEKDEDLD